MRVALCQIDTTVGDLDGNSALIRHSAQQAESEGAELALFCELAITGYPPRDLLDRPAFVDANLRALDALARDVPHGVAVLVGFVDRHMGRSQKLVLYNAAALLRGGRVEQVFHKRLLPSYDVFDEDRYFEVGELPLVFEHAAVRCGVTICEDVWNDAEGPLRQVYDQNPVDACFAAGAELLVNIAASPFSLRKRVGRSAMLASIAARYAKPVAFINALGGNDDLVFDGSSALFGSDGRVFARASAFARDMLVAELGVSDAADGVSDPDLVRDAPASDEEAALAALTLGTRDYAYKCGFHTAVVGLSGGIDSALVVSIAARALGPDNVLGVAMPTRFSSAASRADAEAVARALGIEFQVIDIDRIFQCYLDTLEPALTSFGAARSCDTTFENIQARIRSTTLMAISNRAGHLLLTTGNKSEVAVGYCTLYGDMAGGLAVIADLPKTFVYEVARELNRQEGRAIIPESIFVKAPSAELRPDQTDQDTLPPYAELDPIIERLVERGLSIQGTLAEGFAADTVARVAGMVRVNEYKRRQMPPGLIITSKAFGPGRRYPIAQRFRG